MPDKRMAPKMRQQKRQLKHSGHIARMELLDKIYKESLDLNDASTSLAPSKFLERHENLFSLIEQLKEAEKGLTPKIYNRDAKSWKRFFQWMDKCQQIDKTNQGSTPPMHAVAESDLISSRVDIIDHRDNYRGYGLSTKQDRASNQLICQVPINCMLTTETVNQDWKLAKFCQSDPILSDMPNVVLVMHLLNEYSKGDNSPWFPYLAILPTNHSTIFYLTLEQIHHLKVSNHMYDVIKMIRAITRQYAYFYSKLQATDLPLKNKLTYDFYCWGVSTVCTRQQEIPAINRERYPTMNALIPILDMCNHKEGSLPPVYDDKSHFLRINASSNLKAGDEIFIFYGYRSSGNFFIHNGFVPDRVDKDFIPLILGMNKQEDLFQKRSTICEILRLTPSGRFRLNDHREPIDTHLVQFLVVMLMNREELDWILNHQEPGVAMKTITNYIVDYTQRLENNGDSSTETRNISDELTIGQRLRIAVIKYLSQRAMIYEKVIEKGLEAINGDDQMTQNIISLLKHEKKILAGYCS